MPNEVTKEKAVRRVVDMMSWLIAVYARRLAFEQSAPGPGPDESDRVIEEEKRRVATLRRLREEFENCITGVA